MALELIGLAANIFQLASEQKALVDSQEFQYELLKISLTAIMEGLQTYQSLSLEGETPTIKLLKTRLKETEEIVNEFEKMQNSCCSTIIGCFKGNNLLQELEQHIVLLDKSSDALQEQIEMSNQGFIRGQNITVEKLNQDILEIFEGSQNAMIFWRDYVIEKSYNLNATSCANYFEAFVNDYNAKVDEEDRLVTDRIDLIFQELFDPDGDGKISVNDIADFFKKIWDNKSVRRQINTLCKNEDFNENDYKLLNQLCEEINQKQIMRIFKMKNFNSHQLLSIEYETLINLYKNEIDLKILSALYQKKQEYLEQKNFYQRLEDECLYVMKLAINVSQQVMQAKTNGKLKYKEYDGGKYWIEDEVNGNGLCYMEKGDYIYQSRRMNFMCYSEPAKMINIKSQVVVFSMLNKTVTWDQGFMIHRFPSGTVFYCFSAKDKILDRNYQLVKSYRDHETFVGLQLLNNKTHTYEKDGEFVMILNNRIEYKEYFKAGKIVDWKQFKKVGIESQINVQQLEQLRMSSLKK